jgi:hypothetical protein
MYRGLPPATCGSLKHALKSTLDALEIGHILIKTLDKEGRGKSRSEIDQFAILLNFWRWL